MNKDHHLAAVVFSDIVGYTSMMSHDHEKALRVVENAKLIHQELANIHRGKLIKQLGDGFLLSFTSALDAALFSVELMKATISEDFQLRIGVHLGEVIFKDDDVYGDGVNIASRLQAKAQESQILISENLHQNIRNDHRFESELHGEFQLKNVQGKIKVYELGNEHLKMHPHPVNDSRKRILIGATLSLIFLLVVAFNYQWIKRSFFSPNNELAIALLPFQSLGSGAEQAYFVEGIANEIRAKLTSVRGFTVRSAQSSRFIATQNLSTKEIGKKLNVTHLLDGSIQLFDDKVHFNLFLTDIKTDESIPINLRDYPAKDLYTAQANIAMQVVLNLSLDINEQEQNTITRMPTDNLEAHEAYLLGLYKLERGTYKDPLHEAANYFQEAIGYDPDYADAYIGLAETYLKLNLFGYMLKDTAMHKAGQLIRKVTDINPELPDLHYARGLYYLHDHDTQRSLEELDKAIQNDPEDYRPHYAKWLVFYMHNDIKNALSELEIARRLNPLSSLIRSEYTMVSAYVEGKVSTLEKLLEENPDDDYGYLSWMLGQEYSVRGDYQKALYYLTNRGVDTLQYNWLIGYAYAAIGEQEKALRVASFLEEKYHREYLPPSTIGIIYAGLNDNQNKLRWMKEAYRVKDYWPAYAGAFKPFRNTQWYQDWFDLGTMENPRDPWEGKNGR